MLLGNAALGRCFTVENKTKETEQKKKKKKKDNFLLLPEICYIKKEKQKHDKRTCQIGANFSAVMTTCILIAQINCNTQKSIIKL